MVGWPTFQVALAAVPFAEAWYAGTVGNSSQYGQAAANCWRGHGCKKCSYKDWLKHWQPEWTGVSPICQQGWGGKGTWAFWEWIKSGTIPVSRRSAKQALPPCTSQIWLVRLHLPGVAQSPNLASMSQHTSLPSFSWLRSWCKCASLWSFCLLLLCCCFLLCRIDPIWFCIIGLYSNVAAWMDLYHWIREGR